MARRILDIARPLNAHAWELVRICIISPSGYSQTPDKFYVFFKNASFRVSILTI